MSTGFELSDRLLGIAPKDLDRRVGLTPREVAGFSVQRLLAAQISADDQKAVAAAAFEIEACHAAGRGDHGGFTLPAEISGLGLPQSARVAAASMTVPSEGGFLRDHTVRGDLIIDMLRPAAPLMGLATVLSGLPPGDHEVPRVDEGLVGGFIATEDDEAPGSSHAFGLLTLRPHTAAASTYATRQFIRHAVQGSEELLRRDIAAAVAATIEGAFWTGEGVAGQPIGLLHVDGLGSVVGGTDGLVPAWSHIVKLEAEVARGNAAHGRLAYVSTSDIRSTLRRVAEHETAAVGGWVWQPYPGTTDSSVGMVNGYPAHVSNHAPSDLVKGNSSDCSPILFGNFEDLLIGLWGGLELAVDPYSKSKRGGLIINAFVDVDLAVRRPASFALMADARPLGL